MERFNAQYIVRVGRHLNEWMTLSANQIRDKPLSPDVRKEFIDGCQALHEKLEPYGLPFTVRLLDRLLLTLSDRDPLTGSDFARVMADVQQRLEDELNEQLLLRIPPERREFYEAADGFGPSITSRFPSVAYDVTEACNCYALARFNGAVYHTMRVLETGVQELAQHLGVTVPPGRTWAPLVADCRSKVNAMSKGPQKEAYSDMLNHLDGVRQAWRNPTMHPRPTPYTEAHTRDILDNSRALMDRLAKLI